MEKNKLILPVTILLASIILGGFYYVSETNKQASIEKKQRIDLQLKTQELELAKQKIENEKLQADAVNKVAERERQQELISLQNQDNCSKQAEVFFNKIKTQGDNYSNHYNNKLNKCFVLISSIISDSSEVIVTKILYNVTENSRYAGYYKSIPAGATNESTKPQNCWYFDKYCQSEQEFDNF